MAAKLKRVVKAFNSVEDLVEVGLRGSGNWAPGPGERCGKEGARLRCRQTAGFRVQLHHRNERNGLERARRHPPLGVAGSKAGASQALRRRRLQNWGSLPLTTLHGHPSMQGEDWQEALDALESVTSQVQGKTTGFRAGQGKSALAAMIKYRKLRAPQTCWVSVVPNCTARRHECRWRWTLGAPVWRRTAPSPASRVPQGQRAANQAPALSALPPPPPPPWPRRSLATPAAST